MQHTALSLTVSVSSLSTYPSFFFVSFCVFLMQQLNFDQLASISPIFPAIIYQEGDQFES